jgi:hypothetical protein
LGISGSCCFKSPISSLFFSSKLSSCAFNPSIAVGVLDRQPTKGSTRGR